MEYTRLSKTKIRRHAKELNIYPVNGVIREMHIKFSSEVLCVYGRIKLE